MGTTILVFVQQEQEILVQGILRTTDTLTDAVKDYIKNNIINLGMYFLHPVHRLDRPVSGLAARTSKVWKKRVMELFFS
jgi:23S rRNA pseudouridine1911/1915/1917 synthase